MLIQDGEYGWQEPDDGRMRLSVMAAALAFAGMCGALYAELQVLLG